MGFSVIVSKHEKSKNDCSCKPTHDQTQPETRHGVSGSHCEAQRQNLLCSRSQLSRKINNPLSTNQTFKLRGRLLGGDRRGCDSLRLDRGSPRETSFHQVQAQDDPPARIFEMDQLGNFRASQGCLSKIRRRARPRHRSRNFKSCPGLGQLSSNQVYPDLGKFPNLKTHKLQALKPQAASDKRPNLPLMVGGWAHSSQALGSRTLDKVWWTVERGSWQGYSYPLGA